MGTVVLVHKFLCGANSSSNNIFLRSFLSPLAAAVFFFFPKTKPQASDYRQRSLDNIESASEVLQGEKHTEERAKAQARKIYLKKVLYRPEAGKEEDVG